MIQDYIEWDTLCGILFKFFEIISIVGCSILGSGGGRPSAPTFSRIVEYSFRILFIAKRTLQSVSEIVPPVNIFK